MKESDPNEDEVYVAVPLWMPEAADELTVILIVKFWLLPLVMFADELNVDVSQEDSS